MKSTGQLILTVLMMMSALFNSRATAQTNDSNALVEGNTAFAFDLYRKLKGTEGNLFFSPYSISTCLAMTQAGARGETEKQLARVVHFGSDQAKLHAAFGELQAQLNAAQEKKEVELNNANGLWTEKDRPLLPDFLDIAKTRYDARVEQADFKTAAEAVRKEINDWVSGKTAGKITDLLQPGVLKPLTRLVLVNAIYFKAKWATQFNPGKTSTAPFSVTGDQKVQVPVMNNTASFRIAQTEGLQILELPYLGGELSMVVLLPGEIDGIKALEDSLNEQNLKMWLGRLAARQVTVSLPKFNMIGQFDLGKTLMAMGVTDLFSAQADLSGIDGARELFVSAVVHKAYVDVNEQGTEAAAATSVVMGRSAFRPGTVFRADHPFLFLIRDMKSGSILFMGRVVNPTK